jgi:group I intron endonuclease
MNGIYKISFPNGEIYIGRSFNVEKRIKRHICFLRNNKHVNCRLQEQYDKYKDFEWSVIEIVNGNKSKQGEREKYWIEELKPTLNLTKGGDGGWEVMVGNLKGRVSAEVLKERGKAISASRKKLYEDPERRKWLIEHSGIFLNNGYKNQKTGGDSPMAKKVMNTDTGEIFGSLKDAAKSVNVNYKSFINRLKKNSKTLPFKYI